MLTSPKNSLQGSGVPRMKQKKEKAELGEGQSEEQSTRGTGADGTGTRGVRRRDREKATQKFQGLVKALEGF